MQSNKSKLVIWAAVSLFVCFIVCLATVAPVTSDGKTLYKYISETVIDKPEPTLPIEQQQSIAIVNHEEEQQDLRIVDENIVSADEKQTSNPNPLSGRSVYFSGIADSVVNKDTVVYLDNLEENGDDIFMKYTICCDNETIWTTDLIPSGKSAMWTIGTTLAPGEYNLTFNETPYWKNGDNFIPLTGGSNIVHFKVVQ